MLNPHFQKLKTAYIFPIIENKLAELQKDHPNQKIYNLGVGDVSLPLAPKVAEAICAATQEMTREARGYGPCGGYDFLKEAICKNEYVQFGISPDEIFISDGANADISCLQDLFGENASVAIPEPSYPVYRDATLLSGKKLVFLPLTEEEGFIPRPPKRLSANSFHQDWKQSFSLGSLSSTYTSLSKLAPVSRKSSKEKIFVPSGKSNSQTVSKERVDLVYLCTPCNPTGVAMNKNDLEEWIVWAKENRCILLIDNVYNAFASSDEIPPSIYALDGADEVAIEIRSFSKWAGFTGLRCGYSVIPKTLHVSELNSLWQKQIDIKTNGISYPIQKGAEACYRPDVCEELQEQIATYQMSAKVLRETLITHHQTFFGGENAPYIWWKTPDGMDSWEFFDQLLTTSRIVTIPGSGFGPSGEGYVRLSCFLSNPLAQEAAHALQHHFTTV